jgi:transcriptional regulator GlxA family with amidase domain
LVQKLGEWFVDRATVFTERGMMSRQTTTEAAIRHIGILIFDGHFLLTTSIINEVFQLANALLRFASGQPAYRVSVLSTNGGPIISSSAIAVMTQRLDAHSLRDFHALFVADSDVRVTSGFDAQLSHWLSGTASALEDRDGTTQGFGIELSARQQPAIPVVWLGSGCVSAWALNQKAAQMALAQIAADHGEDISTRIANSLQPSVQEIAKKSRREALDSNLAGDKLHESRRWIIENFGSDISISDAAGVAAMSVRNYLRRFKNEFRVTPLEYLLQIRFDAICAMLVETRLPVDKIARRCGMGNGDRLGRLFRKRFGVSPTAYRKLTRVQ